VCVYACATVRVRVRVRVRVCVCVCLCVCVPIVSSDIALGCLCGGCELYDVVGIDIISSCGTFLADSLMR